MQYFRAEAGHFQHFFEGDAVEFARFGFDTRVGGIDAIDVGVNLAFVGVQGGGKGDGGGIGAATAEGGDVAVFVHALKSGDDDDFACIQIAADVVAVDAFDARFHEGAVGEDFYLAAGVRHRRYAAFFDGDGEQGDADLFAGGHQHVHFARAGTLVDVVRECDEAVGFAAHRRDGDDDVVPRFLCGDAFFGDVFDALHRAHRGAAVFLYDQCHVMLLSFFRAGLAPTRQARRKGLRGFCRPLGRNRGGRRPCRRCVRRVRG